MAAPMYPVDLDKHRQNGGLQIKKFDAVTVEPMTVGGLQSEGRQDLQMEGVNPLGGEMGLDSHSHMAEPVVSMELFRERKSLEEQRDGLLLALQNMGEDEVVRAELEKIEALLAENRQKQEAFGRQGQEVGVEQGLVVEEELTTLSSPEVAGEASVAPRADLQVEAAPMLSNFVGDEQEVVEPASVDPAAVMEREMNAEAVRAAAKTPEEYEEENRQRTAELQQRLGLKVVEQSVASDVDGTDDREHEEELTPLASPVAEAHRGHNHRIVPMAGVVKYLFGKSQDAEEFASLVAAKNQEPLAEGNE